MKYFEKQALRDKTILEAVAERINLISRTPHNRGRVFLTERTGKQLGVTAGETPIGERLNKMVKLEHNKKYGADRLADSAKIRELMNRFAVQRKEADRINQYFSNPWSKVSDIY